MTRKRRPPPVEDNPRRRSEGLDRPSQDPLAEIREESDGVRPPQFGDGEHPPDLFGEALETLPPEGGPNAGSADPGVPDPGDPVGYRSPPRTTRWQRGGPSPNPRGRPPKREDAGVFTALMAKSIEVPGAGLMTKRSVLDRVLIQMAVSKGGKWYKLYGAREARDMMLKQRITAHNERIKQEQGRSRAWRRTKQEARFGQFVYDAIQKFFPGLIETRRRLEALGLLPLPDADSEPEEPAPPQPRPKLR